MAAALDPCRGNDSSPWLARTPRLEDPTNANQEWIGDSMHFGSQVGGPLDSRSRGPSEPFQGLDASPMPSPRGTGGVCTETRGSVIKILPLATMADPRELPGQERSNRTCSPRSDCFERGSPPERESWAGAARSCGSAGTWQGRSSRRSFRRTVQDAQGPFPESTGTASATAAGRASSPYARPSALSAASPFPLP